MRYAHVLVILLAVAALGGAPLTAQSTLGTSDSPGPGSATITVAPGRGTQPQTTPASQPAPPQPWAYQKQTVISAGKRVEKTPQGVRYRTDPDIIVNTQGRGYGLPPWPNGQAYSPYLYPGPHPYGNGGMIKIPWGAGYEIFLPLAPLWQGGYHPYPYPYPPYPPQQPASPVTPPPAPAP